MSSILLSVILLQEYVHFIIFTKEYNEYVKFGLISIDKVHMGHMCMWVFEAMEFMVCFTLGLHWIHIFTFWRYFLDIFTYPWTNELEQLTNGSAHLTHGLSYELNGLTHWLTVPARWSMDI